MKTTTPAFHFKRWLALLLAFLLLQLLWRVLNVTAPSERLHASVPLLFLLDWFLFRRSTTVVRGRWLLVGGAVATGLAFSFHDLARMQATQFGGSVSWRETFTRMVLISSLFICYRVLGALLTALLKLIPKVRRRIETPAGLWLRVSRVALGLMLFFPYVFTTLNVHRYKVNNTGDPLTTYKLNYEDVTFASGDGVRLSGWYIPHAGSRKSVVVCHGLGANRSAFMGVAPFLHRAGFNVLLFDFRGHGESEGHTITFGYEEARDVAAAVDYLARERKSLKIVGYGFSMGGAALLQAVPRAPQLNAVVVDSTFARFRPLVLQQLGYLPPLAARTALEVTDFYSRLEIGIGMEAIEPRRYIPIVSPRPLLIIHGKADTLIPAVQAESNYAAAREPKQLWLVPGANHCQCREVDAAGYEKKVTAFLRRATQRPGVIDGSPGTI